MQIFWGDFVLFVRRANYSRGFIYLLLLPFFFLVYVKDAEERKLWQRTYIHTTNVQYTYNCLKGTIDSVAGFTYSCFYYI